MTSGSKRKVVFEILFICPNVIRERRGVCVGGREELGYNIENYIRIVPGAGEAETAGCGVEIPLDGVLEYT